MDDKIIKYILINFKGYTVYKLLIPNRNIIRLNNVYFEVEKAFVRRGTTEATT